MANKVAAMKAELAWPDGKLEVLGIRKYNGRVTWANGRWRLNKDLIAPLTKADSMPRAPDNRRATRGSPEVSDWAIPIACQRALKSAAKEAE